MSRPVRIRAGAVELDGDLEIPPGAGGVVVFAHGSGSSRFSPRSRSVATVLEEGGLATLLLDLLTPEEQTWRFDVRLFSERLSAAADWIARSENLAGGLFGASTGAAAALLTAAARPWIRSVVCRGGRPDLAGAALRRACTPTLLIAGGNDPEVLRLNQEALSAMRCERLLEIIPGAGHLFEEPGAMDKVAVLARDWFQRHLTGGTRAAGRR
jgi:pimeloyl-ACP methyl ester carboxylesterase